MFWFVWNHLPAPSNCAIEFECVQSRAHRIKVPVWDLRVPFFSCCLVFSIIHPAVFIASMSTTMRLVPKCIAQHWPQLWRCTSSSLLAYTAVVAFLRASHDLLHQREYHLHLKPRSNYDKSASPFFDRHPLIRLIMISVSKVLDRHPFSSRGGIWDSVDPSHFGVQWDAPRIGQ